MAASPTEALVREVGGAGALCSTCTRMNLDSDKLLGGDVAYHDNYRELELAASTGCPFCMLSIKAISLTHPPSRVKQWREDDHHSYLTLAAFNMQFSYALKLAGAPDNPKTIQGTIGHVDDEINNGTSNTFRLRLYAQSGELIQGLSSRQDCLAIQKTSLTVITIGTKLADHGFGMCFALDPDADARRKFMRRCLNECRDRHPSCISARSGHLPTRLVYAGNPALSVKPRVVVTASEHFITRPLYAALSYCWGPSTHDVLKLTRESFGSLCSGIEVDTLSKTVQDALQIVREAGFEYVWIDALCIIQQDPDDWARESKKMAQVYGNADFTIVADQYPDAAYGFLDQDPYRRLPRTSIPFRDQDNLDETEQVGVTLEKCYVESQGYPFGRPPTRARAWCCQEFRLSRRLLIFDRDHLLYSCCIEDRGENGRHQPKILGHPGGRKLLRPYLGQPQAMSEVDALDLWYQIVSDFSGRQLWEPRDIYAALASLAGEMQTILRCRYLAGLWSCDLAVALLWRRQIWTPGHEFRRVHDRTTGQLLCRAPSWSWASVTGGAVTHFYRGTKAAQLRDPAALRIRPRHPGPRAWCSSLSGDALETAFQIDTMQIIGSLKLVRVSTVSRESRQAGHRSGILPFQQTLNSNAFLEALTDDVTAVTDGQFAQSFKHVVATAMLDFPHEDRADKLWCLPVAVNHGLVLAPVPDRAGCFSRCGVYESVNSSFFDQNVSEQEISII